MRLGGGEWQDFWCLMTQTTVSNTETRFCGHWLLLLRWHRHGLLCRMWKLVSTAIGLSSWDGTDTDFCIQHQNSFLCWFATVNLLTPYVNGYKGVNKFYIKILHHPAIYFRVDCLFTWMIILTYTIPMPKTLAGMTHTDHNTRIACNDSALW